MDTAPVRLQRAFVEALGELPQRVLWKYESEILGELPKNVMIRKWFPQRDIIGKYLTFIARKCDVLMSINIFTN